MPMQEEKCQTGLDLVEVRDLLEARGAALCCRWGHVHSLIGSQEYHVCLMAELTTMNPDGLLARFEEAIRLRL